MFPSTKSKSTNESGFLSQARQTVKALVRVTPFKASAGVSHARVSSGNAHSRVWNTACPQRGGEATVLCSSEGWAGFLCCPQSDTVPCLRAELSPSLRPGGMEGNEGKEQALLCRSRVLQLLSSLWLSPPAQLMTYFPPNRADFQRVKL